MKNASTPTIQGVNQLDLAVGGPIRRDRAWFFAAYRYADLETGISRDAAQLALQQAYVQGFEPFNNTSTTNQPYGKVTTKLTAAHQLNAYWQYDRVDVDLRSTAALRTDQDFRHRRRSLRREAQLRVGQQG